VNSNQAYASLSGTGDTKAIKQEAILEEALNYLRKEVTEINHLANTIADMLSPSHPTPANGCEKPSSTIRTVAGSIGEIKDMAGKARVTIGDIAKLLEQHLGELKLEY